MAEVLRGGSGLMDPRRGCENHPLTPPLPPLLLVALSFSFNLIYFTTEEGYSVAESFSFASCLSTLIFRPYDTYRLYEVSAVLSSLLYLLINKACDSLFP